MKLKNLSIFILLFGVLLTGGLTLATESATQWKGTIKKENGAYLVKNTDKPMLGHIVLDTKEELVLKYGQDEDDVFGYIRKVDVDGDGNIFLLDYKRSCIHTFDKSGKYRFKFGGKGVGPGEFTEIYDFFVAANGNTHVLDVRKIHTFDKTGKPVRELKLSQFGLDFTINEKNQYIISHFFLHQNGTSKDHVVAYSSSELKIDKEIARFPLNKVVKEQRGDAFLFYNLFHDYTPRFCFARAINNQCIFGLSSEYKLTLLNEEGETLRIIENTETAPSVSSDEKETIVKKIKPRYAKWPKQAFKKSLQFPSNRPFFKKILADDLGRIFVERVKPVLKNEMKEGGAFLFDLYDREGRFIYKVKLPISPDLIRNGSVYYIDTITDEGEVVVRRYKVTNWNAIKPPV